MRTSIKLGWGTVLFLIANIWAVNGHAQNKDAAKKVVTSAEEKMASYRQYERLQKLTVGPEDNFQATVSQNEDFFIFTEKLNFTPAIQIFDRKSSQKKNLLDEAGDSDQPSVDTKGERVLYRYFKNEARGEICILNLGTRQSECPKLPAGERYSPTWVSDTEFAFLLRPTASEKPKLLLYNLSDRSTRVLYEGYLSSPTAFHKSRQILVVESLPQGDKNWFVVIPVGEGKVRTYVVEVQGRSGFPAISPDDQFVYFAHFISDSNNDQIIDANDRGVIFRYPIAEAEKDGSLFPTQLTSLEQNCSYPWPMKQLYITCDFEGSLDIYQLPLTGLVPADWDLKILRNAHGRARSYEERLLLLNHLTLKQPQISLEQRLLRFYSDYFYLEDNESSLYSLQRMKDLSVKNISSRDLQWAELMVELWQAWRQETAPVASGALEMKVLSLRRKSQTLPKDDLNQKLFLAQVELVFKRYGEAKKILAAFQKSDFRNALQAQIYYRLLETQLKAPNVTLAEAAKDFEPLLKTSVLTRDDKLVFAFFAFEKFDHYPEAEREIQIKQWQAIPFAAPLPSLLANELKAREVMKLTDAAAKRKLWFEMDKELQNHRDDYFLRRVLAMRMILNFAHGHEFEYLSYAASTFTKFVEKDDIEYNYAIRFLISVYLDQGYLLLSQGEYAKAAGHFFGSVLATDDLESHFNFIRAKHLAKAAQDIPIRYAGLKKNQFVADSLIFVAAVQEMYNPKPNYDEVIKNLEGMTNDQSAIRFLLLGNSYLHKLIDSKKGVDFDRGLADQAHRNLVLSLDQGRENERLRAPTLENLGLLHAVISNFGLSAKYFEQRTTLPFLTVQDEAAIYWQWSKSLFKMGDESRSYEILKRATDKKTFPKEWFLAGQFQLGFLAVINQSYDEALKHWQAVEPLQAQLSSLQKTHFLTLRGLALLRTGKKAEAQRDFQNVLSLTERSELSTTFAGQRQRLHALGLQAQALSSPSEQVRFLTIREDLLLGLSSRLKDLKMKEELWLEEILKNRVRICAAGLEAPNFDQVDCLKKISANLNSLEKSTRQKFSNAAYRALDSAFFLSQLVKTKIPLDLQQDLSESMRAYVQAAQKIPVKTALLVFQMGKMELFADALSSEFSGRKLGTEELVAKFAELKTLEPALYQRAEVLVREITTPN